MIEFALIFVGFTIGVTVTNYAYTKRIQKILTQHQLDENKVWSEGFSRGWESAGESPSIVKKNYERLFKTEE